MQSAKFFIPLPGRVKDFYARSNFFLFLAGLCFSIVVGTIVWWAYLLYRNTGYLQNLSMQLAAYDKDFAIYNHWTVRKNMIVWEAITLLALVMASGISGLFFMMRDRARHRSFQSFFASMTHELRTPLSSIGLQVDSIARTRTDPEKQQRYIGRLQQDMHRLEAQIERALELSRIERNAQSASEPVDIATEWNRARQAFASRAQDAIQYDDAAIQGSAIADPHRLQIVFRNLLENSILHGKSENLVVSVSARNDGKNLILAYADNGNGYSGDRAVLTKLFAKGTGSKGTGVGLYLCRSLIIAMGGKFSIVPADAGFVVEIALRSVA